MSNPICSTVEKSPNSNPIEAHTSTAGSFSLTADTSENRKKYRFEQRPKNCKYCNGSHVSSLCEKFGDRQARLDRIEKLKICTNCLNSHTQESCRSNFSCFNCGLKHHTSVCPLIDKNKTSHCDTKNDNNSSIVAYESTNNISIALPTAILPIDYEEGVLNVRALFDQGSQQTLILRATFERLGLDILKKIRIAIDGHDTKGEKRFYDVVELKVVLQNEVIKLRAVVVDRLPSRLQIPGIGSVSRGLMMEGIKLADNKLDSGKISGLSVLVGADYYYDFITGFIVKNNIHLLESKLGYMISGKLDYLQENVASTAVDVVTILKIATIEENSLQHDFQTLWSFDKIGSEEEMIELTNGDVMREFEDSVQYSEGRYIARLPWKRSHPSLPKNYGRALGTLNSILRKYESSPTSLKNHHKVIMDQLKRGFIEVVENEAIHKIEGVHYLPHHGVKKNSVTTPLRIVFNCSSGAPSLNDCLYTGPSLVVPLTQILLRFRLHSYAAVSDIEKAFLMISLHQDDQDYTRFLWPEDPWMKNSKIRTYRFKVVLFGATCSQFLLNASIICHLRRFKENTAEIIARNLYVDNLFYSADSMEEIIQFYNRSKEILKSGNLTLREWSSNVGKLHDLAVLNGDSSKKTEVVKILGLLWRTTSDVITFAKPEYDEVDEFTKRIVLSQSAKLYDPLGYLSPISIKCKVFLQKLWKQDLAWDEVLSSVESEEWSEILIDLKQAVHIQLPRKCVSSSVVQLHGFADASLTAYGAVIYIVSGSSSNLIVAKARVAPLKSKTIPQLELMAALLLTRLAKHVLCAYEKELNVESLNFWTDSQIVLHWIADPQKRNMKDFVKRRVGEISSFRPMAEWRYVPTTDNPSDLASRGTSTKRLMNNNLWFHGPGWILNREKWPKWNISTVGGKIEDDCIEGIFSLNIKVDKSLLEYDRFSNVHLLMKSVALALRFIQRLKRDSNSISDGQFLDHGLTTEEMKGAELSIIRNIQAVGYYDEIYSLLRAKQPTNLIKQLRLILVDGILRCSGRIGNSDLDFDSKHPILLPSKHHITLLFIRRCHEQVFHSGVNNTIAAFRQRFWVPRLRQTVKSVLRVCITCKRFQGYPFKAAPVIDLPSFRTREARPFQFTGVDLTGALLVRSGEGKLKVYISLFTCAVTRAVHLELVCDLTTNSFLNALRRFVGRRSFPQYIYSDNATNFVSASKQIANMYSGQSVQQFSSAHGCQWRFIPKKAPWFGGFWERLIGIVKSSIKKTLGRSLISMDELQTIIIEIEARVNDRPLTYSACGLNDLSPLTPSQLIFGHRLDQLPNTVQTNDEDYGNRDSIITSHGKLMTRLNGFWKRWRREYLVSLREHHWSRKGSVTVSKGDVVLLDDGQARLGWRLGIIEELIIGRDGNTRSVLLRTSTGKSIRPILNLYPLEIQCQATDAQPKEKIPETTSRHQRQAAIAAREIIQNQLSSEESS